MRYGAMGPRGPGTLGQTEFKARGAGWDLADPPATSRSAPHFSLHWAHPSPSLTPGKHLPRLHPQPCPPLPATSAPAHQPCPARGAPGTGGGWGKTISPRGSGERGWGAGQGDSLGGRCPFKCQLVTGWPWRFHAPRSKQLPRVTGLRSRLEGDGRCSWLSLSPPPDPRTEQLALQWSRHPCPLGQRGTYPAGVQRCGVTAGPLGALCSGRPAAIAGVLGADPWSPSPRRFHGREQKRLPGLVGEEPLCIQGLCPTLQGTKDNNRPLGPSPQEAPQLHGALPGFLIPPLLFHLPQQGAGQGAQPWDGRRGLGSGRGWKTPEEAGVSWTERTEGVGGKGRGAPAFGT
ncbi:hypothetical protein KIL84_000567 [Mauremys mutica]|uniref:Uncharacterized protein n=1 Tax=Mauremys mutica TaxID=74926 RepID=A0A9D3WWT1_9SAUR|nr:hypothetical protein KIL84_000567 [Mauremys mutica]